MAKKKSANVCDIDAIYSLIAEDTGGDLLSDLDPIKGYIDTGNLAYNYVCSGRFLGGGIPRGRITEIFGPSSSGKSLVAANIIHGCQQAGGWTILLDVENAANAQFMETVSRINLKRLVRFGPDKVETLEKCFLMIHNVTRDIRKHEKEAGLEPRPIVIVYDSIAGSPCERELKETELPFDYTPGDWTKIVGRKEQPGERARICSSEFRKLTPMVAENDVALVVLNQIRDKIGVLYGCFHYNSRVMLADGSSIKIGKIVNNNMVGLEVLSFNPETGQIEPRKIVQCHNNGNLPEGESFLQFKVRKRGGNGLTQFACTRNHILFKVASTLEDQVQLDCRRVPVLDKPYREVPAESIEVGDKLVTIQPFYLSKDQYQVVYGSILGDGSLRSQRADSCTQLRIDHGYDQAEYCRWKEELLSPWVGYSFDEEHNKRIGFDTIPMFEIKSLESYKDDYIVPSEILDNFGPLALAIWYMDDGTYRPADKWGNGQATIYCTKFKNRQDLKAMLFRNFGLECKVETKGLKFDSENTRKLHEIIAKFVHPSMNYKLQHSMRNEFSYLIDEPDGVFRYVPIEADVLDIYDKPPTRSRRKFDNTVEGHHSYVVDGAVVHNSPETTAGGGKALEFYSSLRVRMQAKKKIEDKRLSKFAGINLAMKNVKNRIFRPFVEGEDIKLYFEKGVDPLSGLLLRLFEDERVNMRSAGNWEVLPNYLPEGTDEYKFKASKAENTVKKQVLLDCPKLIGASSAEEIETYLAEFASGMSASESGVYQEKSVSFDVDGNPIETGDDESEE